MGWLFIFIVFLICSKINLFIFMLHFCYSWFTSFIFIDAIALYHYNAIIHIAIALYDYRYIHNHDLFLLFIVCLFIFMVLKNVPDLPKKKILPFLLKDNSFWSVESGI